MRRLSFISVLYILIFSFVFSASPTSAQVQLPTGRENPLDIRIFPEVPRPGQTVTARLESASVLLDRAAITWSINGKVQANQTDKVLRFTAGKLNERMTVSATVRIGSISYTDSVSFTLSGVDLVWEAKSYTPPFYKGKALFPKQGDITFTAFAYFGAKGEVTNPSTLVYTWKKDNEVLGADSGLGKSQLRLTGDVLSRPLNISVTVTTQSGVQSGTDSEVLAPISPELVMYIENPTYGVMHNRPVATRYTLLEKEVTFRAEPYYVSTSRPHTTLLATYSWRMNGQSVRGINDNTPRITIAKPDNSVGKTNLSLKVTHMDRILQYKELSTEVEFDTAQ